MRRKDRRGRRRVGRKRRGRKEERKKGGESHLTYFEQHFFNHLLAVIVHSHKTTKRFSQKYHPVGGGTAIKSEHLAVQRCLF